MFSWKQAGPLFIYFKGCTRQRHQFRLRAREQASPLSKQHDCNAFVHTFNDNKHYQKLNHLAILHVDVYNNDDDDGNNNNKRSYMYRQLKRTNVKIW